MNGIVIINKEKGFTSFDVVAVVRKTLNTKKVGHTGTLDPNATGVLPVLLGNATKAQDIIPDHDKEYTAKFRFGIESDTLDIWGRIINEEKSNVKTTDILSIIPKYTGEIMQVPPMVSSVMIDGRRLYEIAREGKTVERQSRKRTVYSLKLVSFDEKNQSGELKIRCSKGTYVRSLIDDMARDLKTVGVMIGLNRTSACSFTIDRAITVNELKEAVSKNEADKYIIPTEDLFLCYDRIYVSAAQSIRFKNGNPLSIERLNTKIKEDKKIYRVKDPDDMFLALGIADLNKGELKVYKHF